MKLSIYNVDKKILVDPNGKVTEISNVTTDALRLFKRREAILYFTKNDEEPFIVNTRNLPGLSYGALFLNYHSMKHINNTLG